MLKPKISIIVPIYNVENYLPRCVESLVNQTLKDIEIILVDDGSPDSCSDMCESFAIQDQRVKVIHKKNGGLGYARNSGLEIATGEFVAFVDSDDYVHLDMYKTLYEKAKEFNLDTLFCGFNNVDKNQKNHPVSEVDAIKIFDVSSDIEDFLLDMIGTEPNCVVDRKFQMSVWRAIYSRSILEKESIKFCSEKEFVSEDIIFHIDYLQKVRKIGLIPEPMYYYCDNVASSSLSKSFRKDRFEKYVVLYNEICLRVPIKKVNNRAKRLLIGYTRSLIFILNDYNITLKEKIEIVKMICHDSIWSKIRTDYNYTELPFYQKTIFYLIIKKQVNLLILLSYLKKMISK